eukprot:TRINITY_DN34826_c0_g1_i1.p1 TRINITY_DN34826_c0_g1~~TRINITY_DN34826_c0_g1_i1.p1  ORF type:complete len:209 (+),score=26.68 TRINITY_DN34826_c0_g1_i1:66-629(+)
MQIAASCVGIIGFVIVGATQSNSVYFTDGKNLGYRLAAHAVSSGRRWDGLSSDADHLTIKADREATEEPAHFFLEGLRPTNIMGNNVHSDQSPSKLNFAVKGNLTITVDDVSVTCVDIRLGQGHSQWFRPTNNWWMGGVHCTGGKAADAPLSCACLQQRMLRFKPTKRSNEFAVELASLSESPLKSQ